MSQLSVKLTLHSVISRLLLQSFVIITISFSCFFSACSNQPMFKPKSAKIEERKQIIAYLEKLNPNDSFRFQESDLYPKFKADKPYETGLGYHKGKSSTYYLHSRLSQKNHFEVVAKWDNRWETVQISDGMQSYLSTLLQTVITDELTSQLANPKQLSHMTVEERLYRRVRERVRTMEDVRALLQREKYWIEVTPYFRVELKDHDVFNDNEKLKQKAIPFMKALQHSHKCHNNMKISFSWSQGAGESYRYENKTLKLHWQSDTEKNDAELLKLLDEAKIENS